MEKSAPSAQIFAFSLEEVFVMILIAPAKAFCPNLLAAGPLMTSILSIELRSMGIFRELWAVWESFICIPFSKISTCPNVPPLSEMSDCTP